MGSSLKDGGWSGGAMVLGKLPVPVRPTNLDYNRARTYCTCSSRCGWEMIWTFFSVVYRFFLLSPSLPLSLSLGDGPVYMYTEIQSQGAVKPKLQRVRKKREQISERKKSPHYPTRIYCKSNRPLPYYYRN